MLRVVHAADLHLDASFAFLTGERLSRRREDFLDSLTSILGVCSEERADVLVISGDFFDRVNPSNGARFFALDVLKDFLSDCDVRVCIVSGNHDEGKTPGSRSPLDCLGVLDGVLVSSGGGVEELVLDDGGVDVGLCLRGYDSVHPQRSPVEGLVGRRDVNMLVLHGSLSGGSWYRSGSMDYAPFGSGDVVGSGFQYVALGHLHRQQMFVDDGVVFGYPGCPQRYSFKECDGVKGVNIVDFGRGFDEGCVQFRPLECRELVVQEIVLDTSTDCLADVILDGVSGGGVEKLLNIRLTGRVLFDAYKGLRVSDIVSELADSWFSIKVDREFEVYDPNSDYEFNELRSVGPLDEFKKKMELNIRAAKAEGNLEVEDRYRWMLEKGVGVLHDLEGGE